jgi:hypothetical protein
MSCVLPPRVCIPVCLSVWQVVLRTDQTSPRSLSDWKTYYRKHPPYPLPAPASASASAPPSGASLSGPDRRRQQQQQVYFIDGKRGKGNVMGLRKQIMASGLEINKKRQSKGMLPRPVRAAVIGFPNVGKSSLINRILGRKLARAQNVAGHTRKLQWIRLGGRHAQDGASEVRERRSGGATATATAVVSFCAVLFCLSLYLAISITITVAIAITDRLIDSLTSSPSLTVASLPPSPVQEPHVHRDAGLPGNHPRCVRVCVCRSLPSSSSCSFLISLTPIPFSLCLRLSLSLPFFSESAE